jgi:hypothetical protein
MAQATQASSASTSAIHTLNTKHTHNTTAPTVAEGRDGARRACSGSMPTGPSANTKASASTSTSAYASAASASDSTCMQDEYGDMDSSGNTATIKDFQLECGERLSEAQLCYNTFGVLNARRDNVIVVCHALTGNSRLDQWWGGLLGEYLFCF